MECAAAVVYADGLPAMADPEAGTCAELQDGMCISWRLYYRRPAADAADELLCDAEQSFYPAAAGADAAVARFGVGDHLANGWRQGRRCRWRGHRHGQTLP